MTGVHDMGGRPAGPINLEEYEPTFFDKRVDALYVLLTGQPRKLITTDEVRRVIESLSPTEYLRLSYYERWIKAIATLLVEKEILSQAELDQKMVEIRERMKREAVKG